MHTKKRSDVTGEVSGGTVAEYPRSSVKPTRSFSLLNCKKKIAQGRHTKYIGGKTNMGMLPVRKGVIYERRLSSSVLQTLLAGCFLGYIFCLINFVTKKSFMGFFFFLEL